MQSYLTHELKQFIFDLTMQDPQKIYQILQSKYQDQLSKRKFKKEGKTPEYLALNNPTNEVHDPISRDGGAIMSDHEIDDETLRSIIDDIIQIPTVIAKPSISQPKSS